MRKVVLISALLALLAANTDGTRAAAPPAQDAVTPEEYVVYSALISSLLERRAGATTKFVLVGEHTAIWGKRETKPDWKLVPQILYRDGLLKETLDSFVTDNDQPQPLARLFDLKVQYELIGRDDLNKLLCGAELKTKYPQGADAFLISRAGFNHDRTQALLYVENRCGCFCSKTWHALLIKEKDGWKVAHLELWWVS